MKARSVTTAEFIRHFGRYQDEAKRGPLLLTRHGRASLVVLSPEAFEQFVDRGDPRRVYGAGETPPDLAETLLAEIDRQTAEFRSADDD